jgi:hypothetical protein
MKRTLALAAVLTAAITLPAMALLAERGCHFDTQAHHRGEGHGHLKILREGRVAELPLTGSHHHLDARSWG